MNQELFKQMINEGYISKRPHNTLPLNIYNYTKLAQFQRVWNEATINSRGLILDDNNNIVARGFPKFFNMEELPELDINIPNEEYEVYTKQDGSLGIIFKYNNEIIIATRGSFHSEQSEWATKFFNENYSHINIEEGKSYLVEIIYPENRIVVDYEGKQDLILLAILDSKTGEDLPLENIGLPITEKHDSMSFEQLKKLNRSNEEGFVIKFKSGFRMKIKFENYIELHRIMTGINEKRIWEWFKDTKDLNELLEGLPEEFKTWIDGVWVDLKTNYLRIEDETDKIIKEVKELSNERKKQAQYILKNNKELAGIIFNKLDNKDCFIQICQLIKPKVEEDS